MEADVAHARASTGCCRRRASENNRRTGRKTAREIRETESLVMTRRSCTSTTTGSGIDAGCRRGGSDATPPTVKLGVAVLHGGGTANGCVGW